MELSLPHLTMWITGYVARKRPEDCRDEGNEFDSDFVQLESNGSMRTRYYQSD